jgi:enamine deaminase RidA (YjgF/YER057c/UK114 family)
MANSSKDQKRVAYLPGIEPSARRFPNALRMGDTIYASSEPVIRSVSSISPGIQTQTHVAFGDFVGLLEAVGARMSDLVKLHTFYVFDGPTDRATAFWEQMTAVRLQYFANPGPAGTALRVKGAPGRERLIAIDGVACVNAARQRIMPKHSWDWSIPTPLSQGWRIGQVIYAGGQISADRGGKTVAPDDLAQQTVNTMEFLRHVLLEAGAGFEHIVSLKIGYQHRGDAAAAKLVLDEILRIVKPLLHHGQCALTCLGVDLLYEGLRLEIDAMAVLGDPAQRRVTGVDEPWCGTSGFAAACRVDGLIHVGAISAPEEASIEDQLRRSLQRLGTTLREMSSGMNDIVKLNVLFACDDMREASEYAALYRVLDESLPVPGPVVSLVRVAGLPRREQRVQVDAVAVAESA